MSKPKPDPLLGKGVWCLFVGFFTSWLLGIGLLFIGAAAIFGFIGIFRQNAFRSFSLFVASVFCGVLCTHIALVSGIYVFNMLQASPASERAPAKAPAGAHRG
jgi:hypothetical protein